MLLVLLWSELPASAAVQFDDSFEYPTCTDNASCIAALNGTPWSLENFDTTGYSGCTISTDQAHTGTRSFKLHYVAADLGATGTPACGFVRFPSPNLLEIYYRVWMRLSPDFSYATINGNSKHMYFKFNTEPRFRIDSENGVGELLIDTDIDASVCPGTGFGPYDSCRYKAEYMSPPGPSVIVPVNQWICIQGHAKLNDPGVANGTVDLTINGVQTVLFTNRNFRDTGNSPTGLFDEIKFYRQAGFGDRYWDDLAIGDTLISCGSGGGGGTPPAAPINLSVH